ncbi:MAG: hypothetical protein P1U65_16090 [Minwuia sp.]|nr:hypothetical protein [Minwuia sp.]
MIKKTALIVGLALLLGACQTTIEADTPKTTVETDGVKVTIGDDGKETHSKSDGGFCPPGQAKKGRC